MKKIGLLFATVIMLMLFAVSASAATEGYYTYKVENGEATITDVDESISGDVTMPITLGGYNVTSIGSYAFSYCYNLTSITIPDNVTSVGYGTFCNCYSLVSITIPDSVTSIGCKAFYNTAYYKDTSNWENGVLYIGNHLIEAKDSISSCLIRQNTKTISNSAFYNCIGLTSITIPDSVTSIGTDAFSWCEGLTSITIPDSVTSIGNSAFFKCINLTSITIPDSVTSIGNVAFSDTAYYDDTANWENDVLYIGKHLMVAKTSISGEYCIKNGTLTIADSAFYDRKSLTNIIIPDSVTTIGDYAFSSCTGLTSITISGSVVAIGSYAFSNCTRLVNITIPDSVVNIGKSSFVGCIELEKLVVPEQVESFHTSVIAGCSNLRNLVIKNGKCEIATREWYYDYEDEYGSVYEDYTDYYISKQVVLSGYTGSTTEKYAYENNNHFLPLDGENAGVIQNHKFVADWKIVLPATCTERGLMVKVCYICSDVESKVISPLGHTDKNSDNVCDSCDVTIATDKTPTQQPNQPEAETPQVEKNFFEKIIEWFRNLFNNLFGWL